MKLFIEPTLDGPRRTGRTTRIINDAIEHFIQHGYTWVMDHHDSERAQHDAAKRFIDKMRSECPGYTLVAYDVIEANWHPRHLGTVFFMGEYINEMHKPVPGLKNDFLNHLIDINIYYKIKLENYNVFMV